MKRLRQRKKRQRAQARQQLPSAVQPGWLRNMRLHQVSVPLFILAEDLLTALGRIAAIILVLYVFVFAVAGLLASVLLLYGNTWVRERVDLLKNLRLIVQSIDTVVHSTSSETLSATLASDNRLEQAAHAIKMLQSAQVVQKTKDVQRE